MPDKKNPREQIHRYYSFELMSQHALTKVLNKFARYTDHKIHHLSRAEYDKYHLVLSIKMSRADHEELRDWQKIFGGR